MEVFSPGMPMFSVPWEVGVETGVVSGFRTVSETLSLLTELLLPQAGKRTMALPNRMRNKKLRVKVFKGVSAFLIGNLYFT
jgi:hypothetical protein